MSDKPTVVIDTNVLLDWLVFNDPQVQALACRVIDQQVLWIACPAMREELVRMLSHPSLQRWSPDSQRALAVFDSHVHQRAEPPPSATWAPWAPRCTDADDQVFIDLALKEGAARLFTRDRALLKLARKTRAFGLDVREPD